MNQHLTISTGAQIQFTCKFCEGAFFTRQDVVKVFDWVRISKIKQSRKVGPHQVRSNVWKVASGGGVGGGQNNATLRQTFITTWRTAEHRQYNTMTSN